MESSNNIASRDFFHSPGKKFLVTLAILLGAILLAGGGNPLAFLMFFMFPEGLVMFLRGTQAGATCLQNAVAEGCSDLLSQLIGYGWALYLALAVTISFVHRRWLVVLLYLFLLLLVGVNIVGCNTISDDFCRTGC